MSKKIVILSAIFCLAFPLLVLAQIEIENPLVHKTVEELVNSIAEFIRNTSLILAPILIIIAGFYFITAMGDPKRIETGKKIILYTVIGLTIILIASGLVALVRNIIQGS